ncbi:hypothetical protein AX14_006739 [Amanita brunnescens Koide BX004]|nr:hypothetical protein AX14_006739 [Amanita brunnescens Koide BX004]
MHKSIHCSDNSTRRTKGSKGLVNCANDLVRHVSRLFMLGASIEPVSCPWHSTRTSFDLPVRNLAGILKCLVDADPHDRRRQNGGTKRIGGYNSSALRSFSSSFPRAVRQTFCHSFTILSHTYPRRKRGNDLVKFSCSSAHQRHRNATSSYKFLLPFRYYWLTN